MRTEDKLYALAATRKGCGSSEGGEGSKLPSSLGMNEGDGESTYGGWW